MVINLKRIATVVMVLRLISLQTESSGGLRGNGNSKTAHMVEWIQKSRYTIVHSIEVKSQVRRFSIFP